jgi:hypothetical protein
VSAETSSGAGAGDPSRHDSPEADRRGFPDSAASGRESGQQQHRQREHMHHYWLEQMEA